MNPSQNNLVGWLIACCKRNILALLQGLVLSSVFCLLSSAIASGITVNKAGVRISDDGYHLSASYDINLTSVMQQALSRGITLHFVGEFLLTRSRWYWTDEEVFKSEQTVKLSYNVLTRQYRISRGTLFQNFASFEDALAMLSRQNSEALPAELTKHEEGYLPDWLTIKVDEKYVAAVRLRLDEAQLPKLLQVNALTNSDWTLDSDWYRWIVNPTEITAEKAE